jgi:hypothetical protein
MGMHPILLIDGLPGWLARSEEKNRKIRSLANPPAAIKNGMRPRFGTMRTF